MVYNTCPIFLIYENDEWINPLIRALEEEKMAFVKFNMKSRAIDFEMVPEHGIYLNRMSASSFIRGNRFIPEITMGFISLLEAHKKLIINGSTAMNLELSKMLQYSALKKVGLHFPRTIASATRTGITEAFDYLKGPVIIKPNRAGMGIGVKLIHDKLSLLDYLDSPEFFLSVDGITLVQDYIFSRDSKITRLEFIGKKLVYALSVDTSDGFELCPATKCSLSPANSKFEIIENFSESSEANDLGPPIRQIMEDAEIDIASFEFIKDYKGKIFFYDINVNTNYNIEAEAKKGFCATNVLIDFLKSKHY